MERSEQALARLMEGNRRYVSGQLTETSTVSPKERRSLAAGQKPFAVILACSDSRVPVEMIFDQKPGELFVIRVAGNVVGQSQLGSIEFAVAEFAPSLVLVLGHTNCGAVRAALSEQLEARIECPRGLRSILESVTSAISELAKDGGSVDELVGEGVHANVRQSVRALVSDSTLLAGKAQSGDITILGANYSLESGEVSLVPMA